MILRNNKVILNLIPFNKRKKSMKDFDRPSYFGSIYIGRLLSTVGFVALTMTSINAKDPECCGAGNVKDSNEIKVREIPNVKRSLKGVQYGPYELDYSNEDPAHARTWSPPPRGALLPVNSQSSVDASSGTP